MDAEKLAEAIIARIEDDRAIHKSSLVEEIQRAMNSTWVGGQTMPNMMPPIEQDGAVKRTWGTNFLYNLSDGTRTWECVSLDDVRRILIAAAR